MNRHIEEDPRDSEQLERSEHCEYPEHFTAFIPIYEALHRIELAVPPEDGHLLERLKELRADLARLQSRVLKGWYALQQAEAEQRRAEMEQVDAATKRWQQDKRRASRALRSPARKTVADWARATQEERDMLNQILQEVKLSREKAQGTYGTSEYDDALERLHREVNRRCFEKGLPPYVGERGRYPGYGDEGSEAG